MRSAIKTGVVNEFRGEYAFLSNFYTAPFEWRGTMFKSGEHAFQYAKGYYMARPHSTADLDFYWNSIAQAEAPGQAKKLGRTVKIRVGEWDAQRVPIMREIVHAKFQHVDGLAGQLINTGAMMLVEGNTWGDMFWGRCNGKGYNHLGVILMEERGYWLHHEFGG